MTQPKFAPVLDFDEVRESMKLPTAPPWRAHRPADFRPSPAMAHRPHRGVAGPDQGYALKLAESFEDQLLLSAGEHAEDVTAGATAIAMRRAAIFGRAPVMVDVRIALDLYGFLSGGPEELVDLRRELFAGVGHDYDACRTLVDSVPESTLRLTADQVNARSDEWEALLGT